MNVCERLLKVILRELRGQWACSKNLKEGPWIKVRRAWYAFLYLFRAFRIGWIGMSREQLGERVEYEGRLCYICNWSGSEAPTLSGPGGFYLENADRSKIKTLLTPSTLLHRFSAIAGGWYLTSWYSIDVNNRVYRWRFGEGE